MYTDTAVNDLSEKLFIDKSLNFKTEEIFGVASVDKAEILRNRIVEDNLTEGGFDDPGNRLAVNFFGHSDLDKSMKVDDLFVIRHLRFVDVAEGLAFTLCARHNERQIVRAENHVLCRNGNGLSV